MGSILDCVVVGLCCCKTRSCRYCELRCLVAGNEHFISCELTLADIRAKSSSDEFAV